MAKKAKFIPVRKFPKALEIPLYRGSWHSLK